MIEAFRNKQLRALWETGKSRIDKKLRSRILRRLHRLEAAASPEDMNLPGFNFHQFQGHDPLHGSRRPMVHHVRVRRRQRLSP